MYQNGLCASTKRPFQNQDNQIAKSNNGIVRTKLLTFGVNVDDLSTARARLERVEADICGNFKKLGVKCRSLSGLERLELLHGQLHPGSGSPFRFSWDMIPKTGLSTKDFIAPDSFDFRFSRLFRVGTTWGAASYLQILASELSDKLLAELLEMDAEMTITLHIQTVDQAAAVKSIKAKVSDIDKMKVEEQKKAARAGYDMDILPPDLVTYSNDAKTLLEDLQSRNERMFLLTFLVVNMAPTRRELDNDLFTVSGKIDDARFSKMSKRYEQEQGENAKKIKALRLELKKDESKRMDIDDFLETVRRYTDAATITKRMVAELIDHIEVYHAEKQDGVTNQRVVIYYNCIGAFDVPDRRKIPEADIIMETRKGVALSYAPEQVAV